MRKIKQWFLYSVMHRFLCKHKWTVITGDTIHDPSFMLEGSEYWRGSTGIIKYRKVCDKCKKEGVKTYSVFT